MVRMRVFPPFGGERHKQKSVCTASQCCLDCQTRGLSPSNRMGDQEPCGRHKEWNALA